MTAKAIYLTCECGADASFANDTYDNAINDARRAGWFISLDLSGKKCPDCTDKAINQERNHANPRR